MVSRGDAARTRSTRPRRPSAEVRRLAAVLSRGPKLVRRLTRNDGHSLPALAALLVLDRVGSARVGELAATAHVSQPAMTQLLSRLQIRGLVDRQPDPADGRVAVVTLTGPGRDVVGDLHESRARALADHLMRLDPADRDLLLAALPALERLLTDP